MHGKNITELNGNMLKPTPKPSRKGVIDNDDFCLYNKFLLLFYEASIYYFLIQINLNIVYLKKVYTINYVIPTNRRIINYKKDFNFGVPNNPTLIIKRNLKNNKILNIF